MKLERQIQREIVTALGKRNWFTEVTHGNKFQRGIPDLFLFHRDHGFRWVDVKRPKGYRLTPAQRNKWPKWEAAGVGIWILTEASDREFNKLFDAPNWREFAPASTPDPVELMRSNARKTTNRRRTIGHYRQARKVTRRRNRV